MGDLLLLGWGTVCLFVPGGTVLLAARRFRWDLAVAGAPAVTIGLLYLCSLVTGVTGAPFGLPAAVIAWAVALVPAALAGRRYGGPLLSGVRMAGSTIAAVVGTLVAAGIGVATWLRGLGSLATPPQEHDPITHTELVAHIMRTGQAAPWQSNPTDLLTGHPSGFYPNGFHMYAAVVGAVTSDPVRALNAAMVVLFAVALPLGTAVLGTRLRPRRLSPAIGAGAALIAVGSYHPLVALTHDGGVLANAAALALTPGVTALLLTATTVGFVGVPAAALAICGSVVVHPTSIATVGLTAVTWFVVDVVVSRQRRQLLRRAVPVVAAAAALAVAVLVPFVLQARSALATVEAEPRDVPAQSLADAIGISVTAPYGGYVDPTFHASQTWIFVLSVIGVTACLVLRANAAFLATLAVWTGLVAGYLLGSHFLPVLLTESIFYSKYNRLNGGLAELQWLACGVAVAVLAAGLDRAVRLALRPTLRRASPRWVLTAAVAAVLLVLLVPLRGYTSVDSQALASRYSHPEFTRVDGNDLAAARYVERRIAPGERVMNSANDGSTYGYVYYGLPIVETASIGDPGPASLYTYQLLVGFNRLGKDQQITALVCRLHIAWAIVDSQAPMITAPPSLFSGGLFTVPPGLTQLDQTPHVAEVARFHDVGVYRVDLSALSCPSVPGAAEAGPQKP